MRQPKTIAEHFIDRMKPTGGNLEIEVTGGSMDGPWVFLRINPAHLSERGVLKIADLKAGIEADLASAVSPARAPEDAATVPSAKAMTAYAIIDLGYASIGRLSRQLIDQHESPDIIEQVVANLETIVEAKKFIGADYSTDEEFIESLGFFPASGIGKASASSSKRTPAQGIVVDRPKGGAGNPAEPTQSPTAS